MDIYDMLDMWDIIINDHQYECWCVKHKEWYGSCTCTNKDNTYDIYHPGVIDDVLYVYLGEK